MPKRKINRSKVYHSIGPVGRIDHTVTAKNDVMGSMVIMALMLACLSVMRLLLTPS